MHRKVLNAKWLISDLIPQKSKKLEFQKKIVTMFLNVEKNENFEKLINEIPHYEKWKILKNLCFWIFQELCLRSTNKRCLTNYCIIENEKGSNDIVLPQVANVAIQTDKIELKKNDFGTQTEDLPIDLSFKVDFQRH